MADFKYQIVKRIGVLNEKSSWKKELNLISWNDKPPKYDIRDWDENHEKMSKGTTLDKEEIMKLRELINTIDFEENIEKNDKSNNNNSVIKDSSIDSLFDYS